MLIPKVAYVLLKTHVFNVERSKKERKKDIIERR